MLFSARISLKELSRLCHRLATSLEAGIDMRDVWQREASGTARGSLKSRFQAIDHAACTASSASPRSRQTTMQMLYISA